ncbi:MAG: cellulase family glycosylhydrolase [Actinomycetota bacterium]
MLLAAAVAGLCLVAPSMASDAATAPANHAVTRPSASGPIGHRGRWITDGAGRVLILHGVNMTAKLPPYVPSRAGFGRDDARLIARAGFDTVRLGLIYKAVEPARGHYDDAYLASIGRTARMLGRFGIRVLLDFHQDMYNERFNGEGFPDWAVQDDGLPAQPDGGFPANYFGMPALWRAFDHLWANDPAADGTGLQDAFAQAWRHVAAYFRNNRTVFGYDVLNEPWPGSDWQSCLQPSGCPVFDELTLTPFYERVFHAIRQVDPTHLVFYEPNPEMAGTGADVYIGDSGDPHAGFTFHFYCLDALGFPGQVGSARCPIGEDRPFDVADAVAKRNGDALLMSEFGASDDLDNLRLSLDLLDRHMMSWQYWAWWNRDPCCERPHEGVIKDPKKPARATNVKWAKLRMLARPYPRAVAGTPVSFVFHADRPGRAFTLTYRADPSMGLPTEVVAPRMIYPHGYRLVVKGPALVVSERNARVLELRAMKRGPVRVSIVRRRARRGSPR